MRIPVTATAISGAITLDIYNIGTDIIIIQLGTRLIFTSMWILLQRRDVTIKVVLIISKTFRCASIIGRENDNNDSAENVQTNLI